MTHIRFRFIYADQVIEADVHRCRLDEVEKVPGRRSEYSIVRMGRSAWTSKITGQTGILLQGHTARKG